jgi:hypothetical protein
MGNGVSTSMQNGSYSAAQIAAEAYLAVSQDISQGVIDQQIVSIDCNEGDSLKYCYECNAWWKDYMDSTPGAIEMLVTPGQTQEEAINMLCSTQCDCIVGNIDLSSNIKVNMQTVQNTDSSADFETQIKNSLAQKVSAQGGGLDFGADSQANFSNHVSNLYQGIRSSSVQRALSGLEALQVVTLKGPGHVLNVQLTDAIDYVAKTFQNESSTQNILMDLETSIIQATTQILDAGLAQLILIIVQIVLLIIIIIMIVYSSNLVFEAYTLSDM